MRMKRRPLPSQERLKELFRYDPDTGNLIWKLSRGPVRAGDIAGCINKGNGYTLVGVGGVIYLAHRIIWVMVHGEEPSPDAEIDHRSRDRSDNRIDNLRITTQSGNQRNSKKQKNNTSGVNGVSRNKGGWVAHIWTEGKRKRKWFNDFEAACLWRWAMEKEHGYDPTHGREPATI